MFFCTLPKEAGLVTSCCPRTPVPDHTFLPARVSQASSTSSPNFFDVSPGVLREQDEGLKPLSAWMLQRLPPAYMDLCFFSPAVDTSSTPPTPPTEKERVSLRTLSENDSRSESLRDHPFSSFCFPFTSLEILPSSLLMPHSLLLISFCPTVCVGVFS